MDIFELAKAKKMFGGGGGKREGTAVPVGERVEQIYFNTNSTKEETDAILSQLTYIQTDLFPYPVYPIFMLSDGGTFSQPIYLFAVNLGGEYNIRGGVDISSGETFVIYNSREMAGNGWASNLGDVVVMTAAVFARGEGSTEFIGMPIGTENEKIKNIVSITPF